MGDSGQFSPSLLLTVVSVCFAEKRKLEAEKIRSKYPDRVPVSCASCRAEFERTRCPARTHSSWANLQVIVERAKRSRVPDIDKRK